MSTLKLWAISIDQVRGIFGADPVVAAQLRDAAHQHFGAALAVQPGLLGKLGPLLRGAGDPAAPRPGVPTASDVDDLLDGRFVPPQRLVPAWNLLEFWLGTLAYGTGEWSITESGLAEFDFDLVRAQVPTRYGLSDLFKATLGVSLTPCPGRAAGWVSGQHAVGMHQAWPAAMAELSQPHQEFALGVLDFLAHFPTWAQQAREAGRGEPDLIAIFST